MDLISVIVPVFNVEKYLIRCVESIQNQSYRNLEIILVDDGSPDRCPEMCEELAAGDSRIKVVHKKNGGLGYARNSGLEVVTGKYVTFIDSDDWISENHIENLYHAISKNSADAAIGSFTTTFSDGVLIPRTIELFEGLYTDEDVINKVVLPFFGSDHTGSKDSELEPSCWKNLYSVELIKEHDLRFINEREAISEDIFFNIDYFYFSKRIVAINEQGYYYYRNILSISRSYDSKRLERTINYYHKLCEKSRQYGFGGNISSRINRSFLMKIRVLVRVLSRSKLPINNKLKELRRILNSALVQETLKNYPIDTYGSFMRIFTWLMRHKSALGVYCLMKLRETRRDIEFSLKK